MSIHPRFYAAITPIVIDMPIFMITFSLYNLAHLGISCIPSLNIATSNLRKLSIYL